MFNIIKSAHAVTVPMGAPIEGTGIFQKGLTDATIKSNTSTLISSLVGALTVVGGLAFLVYFFLGAIKWITAGGDKVKVQEAQNEMTSGLVGLIVLSVAYFIIGIVGGVLGLDILNPMKVLFP